MFFLKSLYYQLSSIIAVDNKPLSSKEAVEKSKELMKGNRFKLFCLLFSFVGWILLISLLFYIRINFRLHIIVSYLLYIPISFLIPYIQFATISFYYNLTKNSVENDNPKSVENIIASINNEIE